MKKEKLIEEYLAQPFKVGDKVYVKKIYLNGYHSQGDKESWCEITGIRNNDQKISVKELGSVSKTEYVIAPANVKKCTYHIGANPFKKGGRINIVAFALESILHSLDVRGYGKSRKPYLIEGVEVRECNNNPFVYVNGEKKYYQRPLVWTLEDKQNFIRSIYMGIDCGKIVVRLRGWDELRDMAKAGETELSFKDLVDGKQRINALAEFVNDEFPDHLGNYYSNLSGRAISEFRESKALSYAEMPENTPDDQVLQQFLEVNVNFKPQSPEHLAYIEKLRDAI